MKKVVLKVEKINNHPISEKLLFLEDGEEKNYLSNLYPTINWMWEAINSYFNPLKFKGYMNNGEIIKTARHLEITVGEFLTNVIIAVRQQNFSQECVYTLPD